MIGALSHRFYHVGKACFAASTTSSFLGKLRKATGYSVSNCKKALELFPDDVQKAESWLHSEAKKLGWSKWSKIQHRSAVQGLVGVYAEDTLGIMVEVNCETDFVAKNTEFQHLVGNVLLGCLEKRKQLSQRQIDDVEKHLLEERDLMSLKCRSLTIEELLNAAMSKFNEKTIVKRAVIMKTLDGSNFGVSGMTHPAQSCPNLPGATIGKFGALVAYQQNGPVDEDIGVIGSNMCQHIIGMNPLSIGTEDFLDLYRSGKINFENTGDQNVTTEKEVPEKEKVPEEIENEASSEVGDTFKYDLKDTEETRLLFQSYLLEPNLHVYDYTWKQVNVLDFERFECGGESKKTEEIKKSADIRI